MKDRAQTEKVKDKQAKIKKENAPPPPKERKKINQESNLFESNMIHDV